MRVTAKHGDFRVKAIAGTHTVLIALDCREERRHGLLGFAFKREVVGGETVGPKWLRSMKVFKSVVPDPRAAHDPDKPGRPRRFSTWEHPIQSFIWGDYTATPDTLYKFTIVPMYGAPGALKPQRGLTFEVRTEKELEKGHGVWFNRGAIASQAFAQRFENKAPADPDDPNDEETAWLSRGLLEACLRFINETPAGDGLRVAAYEFTYKPVIAALKAALDRGVDVRILYHHTATAGGAKGANETAIEEAGLRAKKGNRQVLFPRTKTKIPHNKFIVRLEGGTEPSMVWTGSTNFTPSGFLGQTNVGHLLTDAATAKQFLAYWEVLRKDPDLETARAGTMKLTPHPPALPGPASITQVFSPRPKSDLLTWYGDRMEDALGTVMFTAAFGVAKPLVPSLAGKRDFVRFLLMEKPATEDMAKELRRDRNLMMCYGDVLGQMYTFKDGKPVARRRIKEFDLDKWFLREEHYRKSNEGFVFFIHTKFLLIDPLSDDPLVCSGSANFSSNSLLQNDENMLLVRGDTRVADIYLTEFDRIFRHFYFRNVANQIEAKGGDAKGAFLDETSGWTDSYFKPGAQKTKRREMFFADTATCWVQSAGARATDTKPAATKKTAAKKPAAKKVSAKKVGAAKPTTKTADVEKATAKKSVLKKGAAKKR